MLFQGYNVVALSFLTLNGALDQAGAFAALPADQRAAKKAEYAQAGINIIVSAFGETDKPTTQGADPVATANTMAQFVTTNALDGIDVDYEDLDAMNKGDGAAEAWVTTFTQTLRQTLPQGQFILTHAPLAPWLSPNQQFAAGAYLTVNKNVGQLIDWVRVLHSSVLTLAFDAHLLTSPAVQHPVLQPGPVRGLRGTPEHVWRSVPWLVCV